MDEDVGIDLGVTHFAALSNGAIRRVSLNAIYQKLGVSSRVQAVVRARTLGLL
jgi:ATP/maltotriose-dependent transcriptional regulator MalT